MITKCNFYGMKVNFICNVRSFRAELCGILFSRDVHLPFFGMGIIF